MYNLTLLSTSNISISGLLWSVFTYTAMFNSSNYQDSVQRFQYASDTFYNYSNKLIRMRCPSASEKLIDCKCDCNSPLFGITFSTNFGCNCRFNESAINSIECSLQIDCTLPANNQSASAYSIDALAPWVIGKNYRLDNYVTYCYQSSQQYMYSCTYNILIGTIDEDYPSEGESFILLNYFILVIK